VELYTDKDASVPNREEKAGNPWDLNSEKLLPVPNRGERQEIHGI
jgi:hypothetical protein